MAALVGLTVLVLCVLLLERLVLMLTGRATWATFAIIRETGVPFADRAAACYRNLFEVPTLFYAAGALSMVAGRDDGMQHKLAWTFVGARAVQALVHLTFNWVPLRLTVYLIGVSAMTLMWLRLI
jgi:hypothetical protein